MKNGTRTEIVGRSAALVRALELADRFAPTPMPVLLVGATGTGKELFAERIHARSGRRGPLVPVNCAALPRDMIESLLFGHHRGAFTGAVAATTGFVEAAAGGTLFLDELSSLPPEAQVKLLRVLESKQVNRLGETQGRLIDFRVIASAQDDVLARVEAGLFRLDLYQRVAGVVLGLPPLRERFEDVVPLAEHFAGLGGRTLESGSVPVLLNYEWPGNVRELRSAIERAGFLSENGTVGPRALKITSPQGFTTKYVLDRFGQAARVEQPLGRTTKFQLDTLGHHKVDSLPSGHLIRYTWNGSDLTQVRDSTTGRTINYAYEPNFHQDTLVSGDIDTVRSHWTSGHTNPDSSRAGGSSLKNTYSWTTSGSWSCTTIDQAGQEEVQITCRYPHTTGLQNTDSVMTSCGTCAPASRERLTFPPS